MPMPFAHLTLEQKIRHQLEHPENVQASSGAKGKLAFKKVYKGPGYPVSPKAEQDRQAERWINAISPQPSGAFDYRAFNHWLESNAN